MKTDVVGFAPDLDPQTPGIFLDCDAMVPLVRGHAAAKTPVATALPAKTTANSAYVSRMLDGTTRLFLASPTNIYEATSGTAWTDRSAAGGYSGAIKWSFTTFGNVTLATNGTQTLQAASAGGAFAAVAGAPTGNIVTTAAGFVMMFNLEASAIGAFADAWACSALYDQSKWTPSISTQAAQGRLLDSPGDIRAAKSLGKDVVAYKETSMYLGRYVGPPLIWQWMKVPGNVGCVGKKAIVEVNSQHFFVGAADIYVFDGTVPKPVGSPVRQFFFNDLSPTYKDQIELVADIPTGLIYIYYPSAAGPGTIDRCLIYNFLTNQWGFWRVGAAGTINTVVDYSPGSMTYDAFYGTSTYDGLPLVAYDSPFWLTNSTIPAVVINGVVSTLTGAAGASYWLTGDYGDLVNPSWLSRLTPRWVASPSDAAGTNYYRMDGGLANTSDSAIGWSHQRFDFRRSARWHSFRVTQTGDCILQALDVNIVPEEYE